MAVAVPWTATRGETTPVDGLINLVHHLAFIGAGEGAVFIKPEIVIEAVRRYLEQPK